MLLLLLTFPLLFLLTYQANRRVDSVRTGYLLVDLPVLGVVLPLSLLYELLVSLMPVSVRSKQKIRGRVALVTGAGSGIGRAISMELSREGCVLVLWDINSAGNAETREMIERTGGRAAAYTIDVSDREVLEETAELVIQEHTRVDILVCNAGIVNISPIHELGNHRIEKLMAINFTSVVWLTKFFLKRMVDQNYGHILCTSSGVALRGCTHVSDYSASKAALSNYAVSLTGELDRISCNTVNVSVAYLAAVDTPMLPKFFSRLMPLLKVDYVAREMVNGILLKKEFIVLPHSIRLLNLLNFLFPVTLLNFILSQVDINSVLKEIENLK